MPGPNEPISRIELLKLLRDDSDVRRAIFDIACNGVDSSDGMQSQETVRLRDENVRLLDDLCKLRMENETLRARIDGLTAELTSGRERESTLRAGLAQAAERENELNARLSRVPELENRLRLAQTAAEPFAELLETYRRYRSLDLSRGVWEGFRQALPTDSVTGFWAAACQEDAIGRFWDAARECAETLDPEQVQVICGTIRFCLNQYNVCWQSPVYALCLEEAGRPFDNGRHIRARSSSNYSGQVRRVILPGIWNLRADKAFRKSIVEC